MVDKKDEQIEDAVDQLKPEKEETKPVAQKDTGNYAVNLFNGEKVVGQVSFNSAKNLLEFDAPDREGIYNLGLFVKNIITTTDGKTFNPEDSPKDWLFNLYNVAPLALYRTWSASEAEKI